jgi:hypothetical protein
MMNQIGEVNIGSESQAGLGIAQAASGQYSKGLELAERALQTGDYEAARRLAGEVLELAKAEDNIGDRGKAELIWGWALIALGGRSS